MNLSDRQFRRGFSLMMVTGVVAISAVMALAVLSSSTLQNEAAAGQDQAVQADALAESGVNVGLYYIQNINDNTKCPASLVSGGSSYSETGTSLGSSVGGTFDLTITKQSSTRYLITSVGKATSTRGTISKTLTVTSDVNYFAYGISTSSTSSTTFPPSVTTTGDVFSKGPIVNNGTVSGVIYATGATGNVVNGLVTDVTGLLGAISPAASSTNVNHYATYVYKNGVTYSAGTILLSSVSNTTYGATALNPAGIYVHTGNLDLTGNVKVNGTLIINSGQLRVSGTGNAITAQAGYPAAVVDSDLSITSANAKIDLSGLVWLGGKVSCAAAGTVNITGALQMPGGTGAFDSRVNVNVTFDRTKASIPGLVTGSTKPAPTSLSIVSWKN